MALDLSFMKRIFKPKATEILFDKVVKEKTVMRAFDE